jgi:hypothetical protein
MRNISNIKIVTQSQHGKQIDRELVSVIVSVSVSSNSDKYVHIHIEIDIVIMLDRE